MNIKEGDVLKEVKSVAVIAHCCNNIGMIESSFFKKLASIYPNTSRVYKNAVLTSGDIQIVRGGPRLFFINMICMDGVQTDTNIHPLSNRFLQECILKVKEYARSSDLPLHIQAPQVGKKDLQEALDVIQKHAPDSTVWKKEKKAEVSEPTNINTNELLHEASRHIPSVSTKESLQRRFGKAG